LISATFKIQNIKKLRTYFTVKTKYASLYDKNSSGIILVYKQIFLKEDLEMFDEMAENNNNIDLTELLSKDVKVGLHFPAVLPTYAFFNMNVKLHMEEEYEDVVNLFTSKEFAREFS
jgi:hypothetical protein